jgi:transposase
MINRQRISNYKIKKIIHYYCVDIDATKTAELLDFNRNTINKYFMYFREAIMINQIRGFHKLAGTVEGDEMYIGAKRIRGFHGKLKRGRGTHKTPVFGMVQRKDEFGNKYVFTKIVPDCSSKSLLPIITGKVALDANLNFDSWKAYDGLVALGYDKMFRVNHSKDEFALKGENGALITVNGIESFWSFTRRRLNKFNRYMTNLDLHLKESQWRWNHSPPDRSQSKKDTKKYLFDLEQDLWHIFNTYLKLLRRIQLQQKLSNIDN